MLLTISAQATDRRLGRRDALTPVVVVVVVVVAIALEQIPMLAEGCCSGVSEPVLD
jgi:hypothetical protein